MKQSRFILLFLICIILPNTTLAQTNSAYYQDGSGESTTERRERIQNYRQQSTELQQKITALGTVAETAVTMPILFGVAVKDISANFGDPRSGGRSHAGQDIMAVKGTPIVSPTSAVVIRTGVGPSEGSYVYTANPGGEVFVYMHLDKIGEGVTSGVLLSKGSLIGYVGNTGNAIGGADHLHFEIHDSNSTPIDPYPRLTKDLSIQEKMTYLSQILGQTSDSVTLAQVLVTNFRSTFNSAIAAGIALPVVITNAMASMPVTYPTVSTNTNIPSGELTLGSSGSAVVTLQRYLIQVNTGTSARNLAMAGPTGNFGALTKAALIEFQTAKQITPANGYYGASTKTYIESHPTTTTTTTTTTTPVVITTTNTSAISRNLYQGIVGDDVRFLQKLLNTEGYTVATTGAGSKGYETNYFGPATTAAVIKFQKAKSIFPQVGYVGPVTRAAFSNL